MNPSVARTTLIRRGSRPRPPATGSSQEGAFAAEVTVRVTVFRSADDSFGIVAAASAAGDELTLVGDDIAALEPGVRAFVRGTWEKHRRYGRQVRVREVRPLEPQGAAGARGFLCSLPHIGPARAAQLVERFGEETFAQLDADPEGGFLDLSGMGPARAVETARAWAERALYALLAPHGLTRLVPELRRRHGADALERVRSDPYALTRLPGIGFLLADRVAQGLGVPTSEPRRAAAAAYHLLRDAEDQDHSHLPLDVLTRRAARLLRRRPPEADLRSADAIVTEQDRLYRRVTHQRERWTAAALRALAHSEPTFSAQAAVDTLEGLNAEQRAGLRAALAHRVSVITGGPGTGKTFMADAMCRAAHAARLRVLLCAPTGVAARRLAQSTGGLAAHTLHGALQWRPGQPPFHDSNNPLDADIVWVDESSMLSLEQMHHLVDAIGPDTHLVLVGDADQLGPVGPGRPFADLVATEACKVTKLIELFRQAKRSLLVRAARAVAAGTMPPTQFKSGDEADFFFHRREAPGRDSEARMDAARLLAADVVRVVCERIPARYDLHPTRDLHVLSPVKQPCTRPGHRGPGRRHRLAQHTERAPMLSRNLVYTAMTRASKLCVLVGDEPGVRFALDRADADDRYSTLAERLLGE